MREGGGDRGEEEGEEEEEEDEEETTHRPGRARAQQFFGRHSCLCIYLFVIDCLGDFISHLRPT